MREGNIKDHTLKIHHKIYGQKNSESSWNQYLVGEIARELIFVQYKQNGWMFYLLMTVYAMYKDDLILKDPKKSEIYQIIKEMHEANLDIIMECDLQDFP